MPTVNATVRMRSNAARIIRFHQQWPRIGPKQRRNRVCRAAPAHAGSPAARHRRNAGRFDPFFPVPASNDGRAARPPRRNRWTSLASMGRNLRRGSTHQAMTRLPIEFCSQGAI